MADEYIAICKRLWGSWDPGAVVADRDGSVLIDPSKVHTIDYEGAYYRFRGPLNSGPCPQGQPVIAQAGGSDRGKRFAAQHADTIVAHVKGVEQMKAYRDGVRANMAAVGRRNPDTCKVFVPGLADPGGDHRAGGSKGVSARGSRSEEHRQAACADRLEHEYDFSTFDLDAPVGEFTTNGHQQSLAQFLLKAGKRTLREASWRAPREGGPPVPPTPTAAP
jgi:alkanesulfonate monooxygenase SsuD/methylene tetrahydromethanopterin reductase-like flavin-dependent oxidoreductase (luciferase family)